MQSLVFGALRLQRKTEGVFLALRQKMTLHWFYVLLWRHRATMFLASLAVTLMFILWGTRYLLCPRVRHAALGVGRISHRPHGVTHMAPTDRGRGGLAFSYSRGRFAGRKRGHLPPVAFIKTHKTGSSTVQSILFRIGEREAIFAFPYYSYQFSYPQRFHADFVDQPPKGSTQYDILCNQMRLDIEQLQKVMPPNTIYLTLIRDPVHTFESIFSCHMSTVPAFRLARERTASNGTPALLVFLEAPESHWDSSEPLNGLARNPMSFDLGLSSQGRNISWVQDLARLAETFQLVMVAEHFDESLVLLRELLQVELEDLAYVRLNVRAAGDIVPLNAETKAQIRSWNSLDVLLYDFFLQAFWEKVEKYGAERLQREVGVLRRAVESLEKRCLSRQGVFPMELDDLIRPRQSDSATILGYELRRNLTAPEQEICVRLVLPELQYHSYLYFQQYGRDIRSIPTN